MLGIEELLAIGVLRVILHIQHDPTAMVNDRRDRRAEIELVIDHGLHGRDRQLADIERLKTELARRPSTPEPSLWRRGDPLAAFEPSPRRLRERPRERDLGLER